MAGGKRSDIVGFGRFLANPSVTGEALIEGWGQRTQEVCAGRHVLAIQDTSNINFATNAANRRDLGKIGKGSGHGLLLHAMLGVDAETGGVLGLVSGDIWTRDGLVETPHSKRVLADKESNRWLATAEASKKVLASAMMVTEVSDRESDIYAKWSRVPQEGYHILTRAMHDRPMAEGGKLSTASLTDAGTMVVQLRERHGRAARKATLQTRYGEVTLKRPKNTLEKGLPKTVKVSLVEVVEINAPTDAEPILWRLLTTHVIEDAAKAWLVVDWYRMRWTIEQFFRTLKQQGLQLEDSQVESAERLIKLTAIAAHVAAIIMQLVHARDGKSEQSADIAFDTSDMKLLNALLPKVEGKTALQKNPHPTQSLAWASWIIAKLGGWDGYAKSRPPGPITFRNGYKSFQAIAMGWRLRDV